MRGLFKSLVPVVVALLAAGCLSSHPERMQPLLRQLEQPSPPVAAPVAGTPAVPVPAPSSPLDDKVTGKSRLLYLMERGRLAQIRGETDASFRDYAAAIQVIKDQDAEPVVRLTDVAQQGAAVLVNDNVLPYRAAGYERVLLHQLQAENYLARNDLEGAGVEVRLANAEQVKALKKHQAEVADAKAAGQRQPTEAAGMARAEQAYAGLDEVAGQVKNSFQNAYTFYFSGIIYEMLGAPNDAYIDYKKALEIYPANRQLQQDVVRLAASLGMTDDLAELRRRFPNVAPPARPAPGAAPVGTVVVFYEDGWVPPKEEIKIPIPLPDLHGGFAGFTAVAFPYYSTRNLLVPVPLAVSVDGGGASGVTEPLCNVRSMAVKALKEQLPVMVTRQVIRTAAKAALTIGAKEAARQNGNDAAEIFAIVATSVYNVATENADLRSWLSLPDDAQVLRLVVPAGQRQITLASPVAGSVLLPVQVPPAGFVLVRVVRAGPRLYCMSVSGGSGR
jgi:hypothetical protein